MHAQQQQQQQQPADISDDWYHVTKEEAASSPPSASSSTSSPAPRSDAPDQAAAAADSLDAAARGSTAEAETQGAAEGAGRGGRQDSTKTKAAAEARVCYPPLPESVVRSRVGLLGENSRRGDAAETVAAAPAANTTAAVSLEKAAPPSLKKRAVPSLKKTAVPSPKKGAAAQSTPRPRPLWKRHEVAVVVLCFALALSPLCVFFFLEGASPPVVPQAGGHAKTPAERAAQRDSKDVVQQTKAAVQLIDVILAQVVHETNTGPVIMESYVHQHLVALQTGLYESGTAFITQLKAARKARKHDGRPQEGEAGESLETVALNLAELYAETATRAVEKKRHLFFNGEAVGRWGGGVGGGSPTAKRACSDADARRGLVAGGCWLCRRLRAPI